MPGPHIDACIMQCFDDVGGVDLWLSSWHKEGMQWWVGWHTIRPFEEFHIGRNDDWTLIGYELWQDGGRYMSETYLAEPSPSPGRPRPPPLQVHAAGPSTPPGHWHIAFSSDPLWPVGAVVATSGAVEQRFVVDVALGPKAMTSFNFAV